MKPYMLLITIHAWDTMYERDHIKILDFRILRMKQRLKVQT